MGHERVGVLPKTKPWEDLVGQIAVWAEAEEDVADIVDRTISNVDARFRRMHKDEGVVACFRFLLALSISSRRDDPREALREHGVSCPDEVTPLTLTKALREYISGTYESAEYKEIGVRSVAEAISQWTRKNTPQHTHLFEPQGNPFDPWRKASRGSGFCELGQLFFAAYTKRYLGYFLDRTASASLGDIGLREKFSRQVDQQADQATRHAMETAQITRSFAAGWFNKRTREGMPTDEEIRGFLRMGFNKLREELRREGDTE